MEEICDVQKHENWIGRKFYKTAEIAQNKLDVFYAANRLSDDEYIELTAMVTDMYSE